MDSKKVENKEHTLSLIEGKSMTITDVVSVPAFDNDEIEVKLSTQKLKITGDKMEIDRLDLDEGTLSITGKVKSLTYYTGNLKKGFIKRIFK